MGNFRNYQTTRDMRARMDIKKIDIDCIRETRNTPDREIARMDFCIYFENQKEITTKKTVSGSCDNGQGEYC